MPGKNSYYKDHTRNYLYEAVIQLSKERLPLVIQVIQVVRVPHRLGSLPGEFAQSLLLSGSTQTYHAKQQS